MTYLKLAKLYIKAIPREKRYMRLEFVGKRLLIKQYRFLHFNLHPFESIDKQ